jgi:Protein of unknown function (DUF2786)
VLDKTAIIDKIKKLLALASSCNEHEAALAAAHVQRLLAAHNLAMADISASKRAEKADRIEMDVAKSLPKWFRHLSASVSSVFDCQAIHHPATGKMTFIGVGVDVQVASYTFTYLERTVRKLCAGYLKRYAGSTITGRQRNLMRESYYLGAVSTITRLLQDQRKKTPVTPGTLVPVKEGLIRIAISEMGPIRTMHSRRSYINSTAYLQGQTDGQLVRINQGLQHTGIPRKVLSVH